jgi:ketosteroid isomerase-like protein
MTPRRQALFAAAAALPLAGCAAMPPPASRDELLAQVRAAETGFAATMARRDLQAFAAFVADDAVFVNGGSPLRGKAAILEHWKRFFVEREAPFSWAPESVELAGGGMLGYTEGPVRSPAGAVFARFHSTWQRQPGGRWLVVFDNGSATCKAAG